MVRLGLYITYMVCPIRPIRLALPMALMASLIPACDCGLEPLNTPPGSVSGVACFADDGEFAAGESITLESGPTRLTANVDDDGHFFFDDVPAGSATITLPGERSQSVNVPSGGTADFADTACRGIAGDEFGSVRGRVCNGHVGNVVAGADVLILLPNEERLETTTDAEGNFTFAEVPVGTFAISIRGDGFSKSEAITIESRTETVVDVGGSCAIPEPTEVGGVRGAVCSPDGANPLVGARASITPVGGTEVFDLTDQDGRFFVENVAVGEQLLVITKGSFRQEMLVEITANEILQLDEEECALEIEDLRIVVVLGSQNDHVEDVLGSIGVNPGQVDIIGRGEDWASDLLSADERVRDYDILFLSCRSAEGVYLASSAMQDRLREYIADGGSVFTSDQAYDLIEGTFPDKIDFLGSDTTRGAADQGAVADNLPATIVNFDMATSFGRSTASIHYPLDTWSMMTDVANDVDIYLVADAPKRTGGIVQDAPQIVGFSHGEGRVIYSSFHQENGSSPDQLRILQLLMFEL